MASKESKKEPLSVDVVVVGAGVGGLSAGCYCQLNGFNTLLIEGHSSVGGFVANWERHGYQVDGCMHFLGGAHPTSPLYSMWKHDLRVLDVPLHTFEEYMLFTGSDGRTLSWHCNADELERELLSLVKTNSKTHDNSDIALIQEFCAAIRTFSTFDLQLTPPISWWDTVVYYLKALPWANILLLWRKISVKDFAAKFTTTLLREAFEHLWYPSFSMLTNLAFLGWAHAGHCAYPYGGSGAFSERLHQRYTQLGGQTILKDAVVELLCDEERGGTCTITGVRLKSKLLVHAKHAVISAADVTRTLTELIPSGLARDRATQHLNHIAETHTITESLVHVTFGVKWDFQEYPNVMNGLSVHCNPSVVIAGEARKQLLYHVYNMAPELCPEGCRLVKFFIPTTYEYWMTIKRESRQAYIQAKQAVADAAIEVLAGRYPGISECVEMTDVATPLTFERYTQSQQGSFLGWESSPTAKPYLAVKPKGINNLYLAGQWVMPGGGIPMAARTGQHATKVLCYDIGRPFVTSKVE